jgi:hypothetical protein
MLVFKRLAEYAYYSEEDGASRFIVYGSFVAQKTLTAHFKPASQNIFFWMCVPDWRFV